MSDERENCPLSEDGIRYIAAKGTAALDSIQRNLDRARAMLASGEVAEPADGVDPHQYSYPWETTEPPAGAPLRIWRATADVFATGEGLTVLYAAGRAADEDEFRRQIAREFGRPFADSAKLGEGLDSYVQFESMFLSDNLRRALERFDRGEGPPPAMSYFARYYTNYS